MQYFQGKPTGYKIIYHPTGLEKETVSLTVNYMVNTTTLTDLEVYTVYIINVSAVSSGGVGPGNMKMARTTAEGTDVCKMALYYDSVSMTKQKCP